MRRGVVPYVCESRTSQLLTSNTKMNRTAFKVSTLALVAATLALGYLSLQLDPARKHSVQPAPVVRAIASKCPSCGAKASGMVVAQNQNSPDLGTPEGRFQQQVLDCRSALDNLGRDQAELVVVPNTLITWRNPQGVLLQWNFDINGYISEFHQGDCGLAWTHYANGCVQVASVLAPESNITSFTPSLSVDQDLAGQMIDIVQLQTGHVYQISASSPLDTSASMFLAFDKHTPSQIQAHDQSCEAARKLASRTARAQNKICFDGVIASFPAGIGEALGIGFGIAGVGATVGAGTGVMVGGVGAIPGALEGLTIGLENGVIFALLERVARLNLCQQTLDTQLKLAQDIDKNCLWVSN